jgi:hypothetical protein
LNRSGQSVLEFVLLLPLLLAGISFLYRANTAIQMSIVNQKYARSQALFLAYNSPYYPALNIRKSNKDADRLVMGVSQNLAPTGSNGGGGEYIPKAEEVRTTRGPLQGPSTRSGPGGFQGGDDAGKEIVEKRDSVRIRNTIILCTNTTWMDAAADGDLRYFTFTDSNAPFEYCRSPYSR